MGLPGAKFSNETGKAGAGDRPGSSIRAGGMLRLARITRSLTGAAAAFIAVTPALGERVENQVAVFAALDKVTARISKLEVPLGQTVEFGALKVTPRACYSRSPTEPPKTTTFVEIQEMQLDGKETKLFSGWMFAESPGLNAVEHPVFDVWLTECQKPSKAQAQVAPKGGAGGDGKAQPSGAAGSLPPEEPFEPRRRVRR